MKKIIFAVSAILAIVGFAAGRKTVGDPITISLAEAVINTRRLVAIDATTIPGKKICTYRQSGVTWQETNELYRINGVPMRNKYSESIESLSNELSEVKASLSTTSNELTVTKAELTSTKSELTVTKAELTTTKRDLITANATITTLKKNNSGTITPTPRGDLSL